MSDVKQRSTTSILVEAGLMVAMAVILNEYVSVHFWQSGGSVSLGGMVPIIILSYRHGTKWGLLGGFAFSVLNCILGLKYLNGLTALIFVSSIILDYVLPFGILGLSGMFRNKFGNISKEIILGSSVAILIRYISHLVSGYVLWGDIAGKGVLGAILYTFSYNSSYMIPEWIITVVMLLIISKKAPKLLNA